MVLSGVAQNDLHWKIRFILVQEGATVGWHLSWWHELADGFAQFKWPFFPNKWFSLLTRLVGFLNPVFFWEKGDEVLFWSILTAGVCLATVAAGWGIHEKTAFRFTIACPTTKISHRSNGSRTLPPFCLWWTFHQGEFSFHFHWLRLSKSSLLFDLMTNLGNVQRWVQMRSRLCEDGMKTNLSLKQMV